MKQQLYISNKYSIKAVFVLLLMLTSVVFSQSSSRDIHKIKLKSRSFTPEKSAKLITESLGSRENLLIQTNDQLNSKFKQKLESLGIVIHGSISSTVLSVFVDDLKKLQNLSELRWVGYLEAQDKIGKSVKSSGEDYYVIIALHRSLNKNNFQQSVAITGAEINFNPYLPAHYILAKVNDQIVDKLAYLDEVAFIFRASDKLVSGERVFYCPGPINSFGFAPEFVTNGEGWDGPGLGSASLKYHFVNGTPDVSGEYAEVVAALETWSNYADISWTSTNSAGQGNAFDISWGADEHGDGFPFDNSGGVLAHCFYPDDINPEPTAGDMHFDEDENWNIGPDIDVFSVALHEAGHGLGLNHSEAALAVMYPFYSGGVSDLRTDDIDGIRSLYASVNLAKTSAPIFDPQSGVYPSPIEVRLQFGSGSTVSNTRIYYTLDGTEPTPYSFEFIPGSDYIFQRFSNTIKARAFKQGLLPSDVVEASYNLLQANPTVENPVLIPGGGTFNNSVQVFMNTTTDFAVIRYTTNGSEPTQSSFAYSGPIAISQSTIIKAKAFRNDYSPSQTIIANITILSDVSGPQFYPAQGGVFSQPVSVTMYSETPGADIYYTLNSSDPNNSSTLYSGPIVISSTKELKAIAYLGNTASNISSAWFNISPVTLPSPTIFPNGGNFNGSVTVNLGSTVLGAQIRYTTNGAEPTSYSTLYTNSFNLGIGNHTVKAKIFLDGYTPSQSSTAEFIVFDPNTAQVATPVVYPQFSQTFTVPVPLNITCATEGALIRYTVGFSELPADPTETGGGSITYNGPVNIGAPGQNMFIKVRAFKTGSTPSNIVQTGQLSVTNPLGIVANPVFEPEGGIFNNTISVQLSTATQFAQIIYTRDGSEPNTLLPIQNPNFTYNNPINISKSTTISAKGRRTFFSESGLVSNQYFLVCGTPEISPDSGSYVDTVSVTMTSITNNAVIRYTMDGTEPNDTSSQYEGPMLFPPGNYSIRAKAFRFNFQDSETSFADISVSAQAIAPIITTQPQNVSVNEGETAKFFVEASGTPSPTYKWKRNGVVLPGENSDTLKFENAQLGDEGLYSVTVINSAGSVNSQTVELNVNMLTAVDEKNLSGIPADYKLFGNYPNPFNPTTVIKYGIPIESNLRIIIYNTIGEKVSVIFNGVKSAGYYEKAWDAGSMATGVYFLKIEAVSLKTGKRFNQIHKLLLVK